MTVKELIEAVVKGKKIFPKTVILAGGKNLNREINTTGAEIAGLSLAGLVTDFNPDMPQILRETEIAYLESLHPHERRLKIRKFLEKQPVCIFVPSTVKVPRELVTLCSVMKVPLIQVEMEGNKILSQLVVYLEEVNAPTTQVHGELIDVFGVGVLILGKSGIGKSECALELMRRGHRLVADDAIIVKKTPDDSLIGYAPEETKYYMQIRGIGLLNLLTLFGVGALRDRKKIELVVELKEAEELKEFTLHGLDNLQYEILGLTLPLVQIPVKPGRILPVLVEVAALNFRLNTMGYNAAKEFDKRLSFIFGETKEFKNEKDS